MPQIPSAGEAKATKIAELNFKTSWMHGWSSEASCADEPDLDATSSHLGLSETFTEWLRLALAQEITDSADLENAMCAMEVILVAIEDDPHETLADSAKNAPSGFWRPQDCR